MVAATKAVGSERRRERKEKWFKGEKEGQRGWLVVEERKTFWEF